MNSIKVGDKWIGENHPCFFIAEIGQNHQGEIKIAKEMILKAKEIGADCVKFQKSDLQEKFTATALERDYFSENSWGKTYGEHKEFLEFSIEQYKELQKFSNEIGILFTASAMDMVSFNQLIDLKVPFIKIGSGDANNIPLIKKSSNQEIPLIISTGMQSLKTVEKISSIMNSTNKTFVLMHCISSYPTKPEETNLRLIEFYRNKFPKTIIGYSGHEEGILISQAAVLLGAKVIERHFTLNKSLKGSDHKSSLLPEEYQKLIKNIRMIEKNISDLIPRTEECLIKLLRNFNIFNSPEDLRQIQYALKEEVERKLMSCEVDCFNKLGKCLVYSKSNLIGHVLTEKDVCVKVCEPKGIPGEDFDFVIGKILRKDVMADEPVLTEDF